MADLYTQNYSRQPYPRHITEAQSQPHQQQQQQQQQQPQTSSYSQMSYGSQQISDPASSNGSSEDVQDTLAAKAPATDSLPSQKTEAKPQATFLTKLYACVERSALTKWPLINTVQQSLGTTRKSPHDSLGSCRGTHYCRATRAACAACPAQYLQAVAICQLLSPIKCAYFLIFGPSSVYLFNYIQIYGFMRKVNLRNVDPAIDDPDASTWCEWRPALYLFYVLIIVPPYPSPSHPEPTLSRRSSSQLQTACTATAA